MTATTVTDTDDALAAKMGHVDRLDAQGRVEQQCQHG